MSFAWRTPSATSMGFAHLRASGLGASPQTPFTFWKKVKPKCTIRPFRPPKVKCLPSAGPTFGWIDWASPKPTNFQLDRPTSGWIGQSFGKRLDQKTSEASVRGFLLRSLYRRGLPPSAAPPRKLCGVTLRMWPRASAASCLVLRPHVGGSAPKPPLIWRRNCGANSVYQMAVAPHRLASQGRSGAPSGRSAHFRWPLAHSEGSFFAFLIEAIFRSLHSALCARSVASATFASRWSKWLRQFGPIGRRKRSIGSFTPQRAQWPFAEQKGHLRIQGGPTPLDPPSYRPSAFRKLYMKHKWCLMRGLCPLQTPEHPSFGREGLSGQFTWIQPNMGVKVILLLNLSNLWFDLILLLILSNVCYRLLIVCYSV